MNIKLTTMKKTLLLPVLLLLSYSQSYSQCISGDGKPTGEIVQESIEGAVQICIDSAEVLLDPIDPLAWAELTVDVTEALVDAIETAFRNNAYGNPFHVQIHQDKAKQKGGYLWQPNYSTDPNQPQWGEDVLTIKATKKAGKTARITLHSVDKITWWKGLVKFKKSDKNNWTEIVCNYNDVKTVSNSFEFADVQNDYIILSKAKAFGIHTNMYHFVNFDKLDQNYDWSFVWLEDNYNGKYKGSKN